MTAPTTLRVGRAEIRFAERRLVVDGTPVPLGGRAFDLLAALVERRDRLVPKDELIELVWPGLVVEENNLQVQVSALRKVLGPSAITTVPGRGYRFTLAAEDRPSVPAVVETARRDAATMATRTRAPRAPAGGRLLVAEDNKVNRLLLCRSLELLGHAVEAVADGTAALAALRAGTVELLLLDLEMPGLDGFGVLEARAAEPALVEIPVIVTSSVEGAAAVARCIELGADDFLHKPVDPLLLRARVESSLERKRLRDRERSRLARLAPEPAAGSTDARRVEATILVARLRDIDAATATVPPAELMELLGAWTTLMVDAAEGHGGHVERLEGDGVVASFGAARPLPSGLDAASAADQAAKEMRALTAALAAERRGGPSLGLAIGMATGKVLVGPIGTARRAVIGSVGSPARRAAAAAEEAARDR